MDTDLTSLLQTIQERLEKIEEKMSSHPHQNEASNNIHLSIQEVNIQTFNLEELAYHLKQLDVKELSGMINLGNTFSPIVGQKHNSKKNSSTPPPPPSNKSENQTSQKKPDEINVMVNGKKIIPKILKKQKGSGTN